MHILFIGFLIWFTIGLVAAFLENLAYVKLITMLESGEHQWEEKETGIKLEEFLKALKLTNQHRTAILTVGLSALKMPLTVVYAFAGWYVVAQLPRKR